jgi:hypothetical protein
MRPYSPYPEQQMALVKAHQEMLREDWRLANYRKSHDPNSGIRAAVRRTRARVGIALIDLGRRLAQADRVQPLATFERHPDMGC